MSRRLLQKGNSDVDPTVYYNWIKVHKTLRVTPAMQSGLSNQVCTCEDLGMQIEAATPKPEMRGPYRKKALK